MGDQQTILSVKALNVSFPKNGERVQVLRNVSFDIKRGETVAVVGESGSGKSITALSIMGLQPQSARVSGNILFGNEFSNLVTNKSTEWQNLRGKDIGMVFQEPMSSLNPVMKVGKQLQESIYIHQKHSKTEAKLKAIQWLKHVQLPNPENIYNRYPHQLSGGQKQRVMIAMAMCNMPKLLIADEPTTALDVTVQKEVVELMQSLQQEYNMSMIFITHDLALAATIADRIIVMYKGEIVEQGNTTEILNNSVHPYTKALLACRPNAGMKNKKLPTVSDFLDADKSKSSEEVISVRQYNEKVDDDEILQVCNMKVWFADSKGWFKKHEQYFKAVDGVSFNLKRGEVLGLVGESGCGKSTVSKALMGLVPIKEGQIVFQGRDLSNINRAEWKKVRRDIQLIFQDPYASLNPRMTVGETLSELMKYHHILSGRELKKEIQRLMDIVQMPENAINKYPHEFSGGQRQRIGIARALALRPKLLICDESVSALDVSVQAQVLNLLKDLQHEFHLSYLFISHDLSVVHYISDRVLVMKNGTIVESGKAEEVLTHPKTEYTQSLVGAMPVISKSA